MKNVETKFERLNSLKVRSKEASEEQKARWVEELPGYVAAFAPGAWCGTAATIFNGAAGSGKLAQGSALYL